MAAPIRARPAIGIEHATCGISGREPSALGHGRFKVKFGCGVVARPRGGSTMLRLLSRSRCVGFATASPKPPAGQAASLTAPSRYSASFDLETAVGP